MVTASIVYNPTLPMMDRKIANIRTGRCSCIGVLLMGRTLIFDWLMPPTSNLAQDEWYALRLASERRGVGTGQFPECCMPAWFSSTLHFDEGRYGTISFEFLKLNDIGCFIVIDGGAFTSRRKLIWNTGTSLNIPSQQRLASWPQWTYANFVLTRSAN